MHCTRESKMCFSLDAIGRRYAKKKILHRANFYAMVRLADRSAARRQGGNASAGGFHKTNNSLDRLLGLCGG